jgi:hypothetical protein
LLAGSLLPGRGGLLRLAGGMCAATWPVVVLRGGAEAAFPPPACSCNIAHDIAHDQSLADKGTISAATNSIGAEGAGGGGAGGGGRRRLPAA